MNIHDLTSRGGPMISTISSYGRRGGASPKGDNEAAAGESLKASEVSRREGCP
jgi:hypothetical protein